MYVPEPVKKDPSLWTFMLLGLVVGATIFVVAFWFRVEPVYTWALGIGTAIATGIGNLKLPDFSHITEYILATPERMVSVLTACITIPAAIYGLISKVRADKARAEAEVQKAQAELDASRYIQGLTTQNEALQTKVTSLEGQVKNNTYYEQLQESQNIVTRLQQENKKLQTQMDEIHTLVSVSDSSSIDKLRKLAEIQASKVK